jgi:hypothetical protein
LYFCGKRLIESEEEKVNNKRKEMHPLDLPAVYDELNQAEKDALAYWIEHAICKATKYSNRTSYGIKHDFEREEFYITNGQFKGAMLAAGYQPEDAQELNWTFKIKPYKANLRPGDDPGWFRLGQDEPTCREFAHLLTLVREAEEHVEQTAFLVLVKHRQERDTHLYSLLAADQERAKQQALGQFEQEYAPDELTDWKAIVLQPTFGDQPTHVARLDQGL